MGCCLTTTAAAADDSKPRDAPPPPLPPPLVFEEESVKRVLSETPIIPKQSTPSNSTTAKLTGDNQRSLLRSEKEFTSGHVIVQSTKNPVEENASEASSGMYTCSASFSAATTTTIGDGIDEDGEVTQKVNKPSPSKLMRRRQQGTFSSDRTRRERGVRQPSPAKRSAVPCSDKKPQVPSSNTTTAGRQGNVVPSNVVRREPPARRSRSPTMRGEAGQVLKVKERSPVRQGANRVPVSVTEKRGNVVLKKPDDGVGVQVPEPEPKSEPETGESLENPLVSLECFIFL